MNDQPNPAGVNDPLLFNTAYRMFLEGEWAETAVEQDIKADEFIDFWRNLGRTNAFTLQVDTFTQLINVEKELIEANRRIEELEEGR